jgi:hypothetical protein
MSLSGVRSWARDRAKRSECSLRSSPTSSGNPLTSKAITLHDSKRLVLGEACWTSCVNDLWGCNSSMMPHHQESQSHVGFRSSKALYRARRSECSNPPTNPQRRHRILVMPSSTRQSTSVSTTTGGRLPSDAELDKLIQECLDDPDSQLKLTLFMWDFGGQKLFLSMHQLFLTHNGVYIVVFNTQELFLTEGQVMACGRPVNATTRETCLRYLREWLNSIFIFAPGAPAFIVGTCLDHIHKIENPDSVMADICDLIRDDVLLLSPCHEQVVYDDRPSDNVNNCCFFLSNFKEDGGGEDPSVAVLRSKVGEHARDQPHVHETAPLHWLRALDRVSSDASAAKGPARITRREFVDRARAAGLGSYPDVPLELEVDALLSKFHDLGLLLWYVDPPLLVGIEAIVNSDCCAHTLLLNTWC